MKNIFIFIFTISFSLAAQAHQAAPQLLKEPAAWQFERFDLPPAFAPGFPYYGAEELGFSLGMFKKDSQDYFTYAFVSELESTKAFRRKTSGIICSGILKVYVAAKQMIVNS